MPVRSSFARLREKQKSGAQLESLHARIMIGA